MNFPLVTDSYFYAIAAPAVVPLPLAPLGLRWGVRLARRYTPIFFRLTRLGMFLTGCMLLRDGLH